MLISVCIPTYSRLNYLKIAVSSVAAQNFKDFEACIALDPKPEGPDQEILNWCKEYAALHPWFRYQVNTENVGLAGNWNVLTRMAKGDYLIIIGDDDTLEPSYLENIARNIGQHHPDVVFCDQNFIDLNGEILALLTEEMTEKYGRSNLPAGVLRDPVEAVLNNTIPMSASVIRRAQLLKYPFDESLNTPELEVFLKIATSGGTFEYVSKRLANYRVHPGSATSGGLKLHYFLRNIILIDVPVVYEHLKYKLVSSRIIPAINICIREGNAELAKKLLNSRYYPAGKFYLKLVQFLLLSSPSFIIKRIL